MMDSPVTVALNGQINPLSPGGSESSVMSVVNNVSTRPDAVSLKFLALPQFFGVSRDTMPRGVGCIEWPFPLSAPVTSIVQSDHWVKLRQRLGPFRPVFDYAVWARRAMAAERRIATAEMCDAILSQHGVDVVHFGWPMHFPTRLPFIYEPHDLQHRHYPEFFPKEVLRWRAKVYGAGCRNARFVVCGTWWTKNDIMRQYDVPCDRVAVIPRASVNARAVVPAETEAGIVSQYNLDQPFAFYPAMTFRHKNHVRLIEAIRNLRDRGGPAIRLLCTGRGIQPVFAEIKAQLESSGLAEQVKFLGTVPDDVLTVLYKRATMMVFPSLFEGHSQSLLEGLNQGLPVIAARQSSIPETCGKAGLYFDGESVPSIEQALAEAWTNPGLLQSLAAATPGECARYEWSGAREAFIAVYRKAAGRALDSAQEDRLALALRKDF